LKHPTKLIAGLVVVFFLAPLFFACESGDDKSIGPDQTDDTIKILMIGNSLTYFNDQPGMLESLAATIGRKLLIEKRLVSGIDLKDHCQSSATREKIYSRPWDYVILQDCDYGIAIPSARPRAASTAKCLCDMIRENSSQTKIIYCMSYARKNGAWLMGQQYTFEELQKKICEGTIEVADQLEIMIAPIGWAWYGVVKSYPEMELYAPDRTHPSPAGSFLGACVYFAVIFREVPKDNGYFGGLSPEQGAILQEVGCFVVMRNLKRWNRF